MDIKELCRIGEEEPALFEEAAKEYVDTHIKKMCNGDAKKEWRLNGQYHRLDAEAKNYVDPVARLNFVISRFWNKLGTYQNGSTS